MAKRKYYFGPSHNRQNKYRHHPHRNKYYYDEDDDDIYSVDDEKDQNNIYALPRYFILSNYCITLILFYTI